MQNISGIDAFFHDTDELLAVKLQKKCNFIHLTPGNRVTVTAILT